MECPIQIATQDNQKLLKNTKGLESDRLLDNDGSIAFQIIYRITLSRSKNITHSSSQILRNKAATCAASNYELILTNSLLSKQNSHVPAHAEITSTHGKKYKLHLHNPNLYTSDVPFIIQLEISHFSSNGIYHTSTSDT